MKLLTYRRSLFAGLCLGAIGLFAGRYQFSISFEPAISEVRDTSSQGVEVPEVNSNQNNAIAGIPQPTNLLTYHSDLSIQGKQGKLRASNQTNQPVRLALLSKGKESLAKTKTNQSVKPNGNSQNYIPVHWDFAPQEGSETGMVLSPPQGNLDLEPGDIMVAFAQDGSRRYWGPYIVGETQYPIWNPQTQEWQFIFTP